MSRAETLARRHLIDALIVVVAIATVVQVAVDYTWPAACAAGIVVLPLLARERFTFLAPLAVWVFACALSFPEGQLVASTPGLFVSGMAAAVLLGQHPDAIARGLGLAVAVAGIVVVVANDPGHSTDALFIEPVVAALAWLAGLALRERAAQARAAEERAALAERERAATARAAVAEERARIARELHDIVAHTVSVMVLQVGAVRHKLPASLADDREALTGVERTGRDALIEMRRLLGALRKRDEDVALAPQPGLAALDTLVEGFRGAGLEVELRIEGDLVTLPPPLDLSAYRIVQEGLTNTLKHAPAAHADVTVSYAPKELEIVVRDDGDASSHDDGLGYGLVGIRERVKVYGGEMSAGPGDGGGYVLRARLPLNGTSR